MPEKSTKACSVSFPSFLFRALALGLSAGIFCTGLCVPLLGPVLLSRPVRTRESATVLGLFLVGRLTAYLAFGLVVGALGRKLAGIWLVRPFLLPVLYFLLGAAMITYGLVQSFPHIGLCRALGPRMTSAWYPAALGFLAGINLCPPFLLAIVTVADIGGVLSGILFFLLFFLATSIYLMPLAFSGLVSRFDTVRFAARVATVVSGIHFILVAARSMIQT